MIIAIDPGTKCLGIAVADNDTVDHTVRLYSSAVIEAYNARHTHIVDRDDDIVDQMLTFLQDNGVEVTGAIIEMPRPYFSHKGEAAANSGAIIKLGFITGMVYQAIRQTYHNIPILTPHAIKWKGTVPKEITQQRILRHWGFCPEDHNEADAIGILDWYFRKELHQYHIIKWVR